MEENKNKVRKMFHEDLPRWRKGRYYGMTNWKECIGHKAKFIYGNIEGTVEIIDYFYEKGRHYLKIKYKDKILHKIDTVSFKDCQLGKLLGVRTTEFKIEIGKVFKDDKRDLVIIDRELRDNPYNKGKFLKYYKYKCNKCRYAGWMEESNLLKEIGCSCCYGRTVVQGVNDIPTTAPWMVKYFQGGYDEAKLYTRTSNKKIYPICPDCNRVKSKEMQISKIYTKKSIGCSCGDGTSYPNKLGFSLLEQFKIQFTNEYTPEWVKPRRYDFYFELNNKKYIVEMDGGFHGNDNKMSGKTKEENDKTDDYKDKLASEHGIEVIRIKCNESDINYIKDKILNSRLQEIFDLSNIDWIKVEEFALSNRVKEACEYKRNNPNMSTTEIGEMMNLEGQTIRKYLKKGSKIWDWINYDPKKENHKGRNKSKFGKPIEMFGKDGISKGIFRSATELEKLSENLFGVKLNNNNISNVCNGKSKSHKGFTFRFVETFINLEECVVH